MSLTAQQINEIAQDLDMGMKVYINKDTLEYKAILDWDGMTDVRDCLEYEGIDIK